MNQTNVQVVNKVQVVVAWYNEDIQWIYDSGIDKYSIIYSKGIRKDLGIQLPNVGREGHTYLIHIIDNYDNLSDYTFFIQGQCSDHCPDIATIIKEHADGTHPINEPFRGLGTWRLYLANDLSCPHWQGKTHVTQRMFNDLFESPLPTNCISFTAGAIFVASRYAIKSRSLDFWKKCLKHVEYDINPPEVYSLERIWEAIFDPQLKERKIT